MVWVPSVPLVSPLVPSVSPVLPASPAWLSLVSSCYGSFTFSDVRNCQPLCLAIKSLKLSDNPDVRDFAWHCEQGATYERLGDWFQKGNFGMRWLKRGETDPSKWNRDQLKKKFMVGVFGEGNDSPLCIAIKDIWPTVAQIMSDLKEVRYENLAWTLQKIESSTMIKDAAWNFSCAFPQTIFGTIHDCIGTPQMFQEASDQSIINAFAKHGVRPSISHK